MPSRTLYRAGHLDPGKTGYATWRLARAHAHFYLGRYYEAVSVVEQMLLHSPNAHPALRIGTASAAFGDRREITRRWAALLLQSDAKFRISRLADYLGPYRDPGEAGRGAEAADAEPSRVNGMSVSSSG